MFHFGIAHYPPQSECSGHTPVMFAFLFSNYLILMCSGQSYQKTERASSKYSTVCSKVRRYTVYTEVGHGVCRLIFCFFKPLRTAVWEESKQDGCGTERSVWETIEWDVYLTLAGCPAVRTKEWFNYYGPRSNVGQLSRRGYMFYSCQPPEFCSDIVVFISS